MSEQSNPETQTKRAYCISVNKTIRKIRTHLSTEDFQKLKNLQEEAAQTDNKLSLLLSEYRALKRFEKDAEKMGCKNIKKV